MVAGSGVWWSPDGAAALQGFVDATGMPVVTRQAGRGTVPDDHPLSMGRDWQQVVAQADVLLVVGSRMNYFFGYGAFGHLDALIQVDIDPEELGRSVRAPDLGVVADAGAFLRRLTDALGPLDLGDWSARLRAQRDEITAAKARLAASDATPLHPMRVCAEVSRRLPDGATVIPDGSNNVLWCNVGFDAPAGGASRAWVRSARSVTASVSRSARRAHARAHPWCGWWATGPSASMRWSSTPRPVTTCRSSP